MRILDSQLRKIIRSEIRKLREVSASSTATGGATKRKGTGASKSTAAAKTDYDTKGSDYDTKKSDLDAFAGSKYRKVAKGKGYTYSSTGGGRGSGWSINPDWLTKDTAKSSAKTARDAALTKWNTQKAKDASAERAPKRGESGYQAQRTGGAPGPAGEKGKGKKGKDDE